MLIFKAFTYFSSNPIHIKDKPNKKITVNHMNYSILTKGAFIPCVCMCLLVIINFVCEGLVEGKLLN